MSVARQKREMRIRMRQEAAKLSREEMLFQSDNVFGRVEELEQFKKAKTVALFWSLSDELPTRETALRWTAAKRILLPYIDGDRMYFREYHSKVELEEGPSRILQPASGDNVRHEEIDLILVPGVAFDPEGCRLGRGKGYYDNYLAAAGAFVIGICMSHQLVDKVPCESHDRKVDMVICPETTIHIGDKGEKSRTKSV